MIKTPAARGIARLGLFLFAFYYVVCPHHSVQTQAHPVPDEKVQQPVFRAHGLYIAVLTVIWKLLHEVGVQLILHGAFPVGKIHARA